MGHPCIRQPKRKLPENGSLRFIFFVKKGPGGKHRERVRAIDRSSKQLSSDVPNQTPLNETGNIGGGVLNVFCFYGVYGYSA